MRTMIINKCDRCGCVFFNCESRYIGNERVCEECYDNHCDIIDHENRIMRNIRGY